jgi:retinoid hydroxylase
MGLPVIGESIAYLKSPEQFVLERRARYGNVFRTNILGIKTVFMLGPEANRWLFANDGKAVENRWNAAVRRLLGQNSVSLLVGKPHRDRRRLLSPLYTLEASRQFAPTMAELADRYFHEWAESRAPITLFTDMRALAFEIATVLTLGADHGLDVKALSRVFLTWTTAIFSPLAIAIPGTRFHKALRAKQQLIDTIMPIVVRRLQLAEQSHDTVGSLIKARDEAGRPLSAAVIVDEVMLQLFAGHDTTVATMSNLMLLLARHPAALARAREEVCTLANPGQPSPKELESLPYLNALIMEGMRVIPTVAGAFRQVVEDTSYAGYRLPRGWYLGLSILGAARGPGPHDGPVAVPTTQERNADAVSPPCSACRSKLGSKAQQAGGVVRQREPGGARALRQI